MLILKKTAKQYAYCQHFINKKSLLLFLGFHLSLAQDLYLANKLKQNPLIFKSDISSLDYAGKETARTQKESLQVSKQQWIVADRIVMLILLVLTILGAIFF